MFPLQDPGPPSGKNPAARWTYTPIKNGTGQNGFLAGQPTWVKCHFVGTSKPCRSILTGGALACHYCAGTPEPVWRGFTPWYDACYVRCFSCITEDYRESVSEIPLHAQIKLTRGKGTREPLVITPSFWRPTELPKCEDRHYNVDLRHVLLKCWKDAELIAWCQSNQMQSVKHSILQNDDVLFPEGAPTELVNRVLSARSSKPKAEPVPFDVVVRKTADGKNVIGTERRNGKH